MAEMTDAQFKQKVIDILDEVGAALNREGDIDVISSLEEWNRLAASITLPGIEMEQAEVKRYVAAPLSYFAQYCEAEANREKAVWLAWFGVAPSGEDPGSGVQGEWSVLKKDAEDTIASVAGVVEGIEQVVQAAETATSEANTAAGTANDSAANADEKAALADDAAADANTAAGNANDAAANANEKAGLANTAAGNANDAAANANEKAGLANTAAGNANTAAGRVDTAISNAETATAGAENVNAEINGMTVTITNRQGSSTSVNISFDIYAAYPSVAAMNADRTNIPLGALASIATTDPTDPENARLYQRRSSDGQMIFIGDLDQAAAAAWSEWFNTKKPLIDAAITSANNAAANANSEASAANTAASNANNKAGEADSAASSANTQASYALNQGNYAKNIADHPPYIADGTAQKPGDVGFYYQWDYTAQQYVKDIRISLDWSTMSDAEKEALAAEILASIAFDDVPTQYSNKAVRSSGIYDALQGKQDTLTFASDATCEDIIDELT